MSRAQDPGELNAAIETVRALSDRLAVSYDRLESCVSVLNQGLARVPERQLEQLAVNSLLVTRLQALIDAIPGAVVVLDDEGRVGECNEAARELLQPPLVGEPWREVVERSFRRRLERGELVSPGGRHLSVSTCPLGREPGQIVLLTDVTETRVLQSALERNERLTAMGRTVASLAHQIRTPLASAMLYLSQLDSERLDEAGRARFKSRIEDRLRHLEQMVNDMLVFAHGGRSAEDRVEVDRLLDEVAQQLEPQLRSAGACLQLRAEDSGLSLWGNQDALLGALCNLGVNALQACGEGLTLTITARLTEQRVELEVADNGPGIDPQVQERIFEPFFTTRSDGTGLGLAVVESVVKSHRGRIELESAPGRGSHFRLSFPVDDDLLLSSGAAGRAANVDAA